MSNSTFRNRAIVEIGSAIAEYEISKQINHPSMKGRIREILVEKVLRKFIISGYDIGTGKMVDYKNCQSHETDVIIYNKNILPPILYSERDGIFPIESCMYAIEVKSEVNKNEIKDTYKKFKGLEKLEYTHLTPVCNFYVGSN